MAQNITIAGVQYPDVPAIQVPKTGSGTATFVDTSDADAVAADIALNKTAYVNGIKIVGTSEGGGGTSYMETLWTNASVSSSFSAQEVTLSDSANNYDYLLIDYIFSTSAQDHATQLVAVTDLAVVGREYSLRINAATYNRTGARNFRFVYSGSTINYTKLYFDGASYNTSSNNGYAIPYRIIGIKLTIPSASGVSF